MKVLRQAVTNLKLIKTYCVRRYIFKPINEKHISNEMNNMYKKKTYKADLTHRLFDGVIVTAKD
jgi:hypothetical protein